MIVIRRSGRGVTGSGGRSPPGTAAFSWRSVTVVHRTGPWTSGPWGISRVRATGARGRRLAGSLLPELRHLGFDLPFPELEESLLVVADLVEVDVVETRVHRLADGLQQRFGIGPAGNRFAHHLGR